jgi:hypothetical protein
MASIGIIANPASGKDIRRLVSHATVIDNNEKINIVERIVLGAQALGVEKVFVMPDSYNMGYRVEDKLNSCNELRCEINVVNMMRFDGMEDTVKAAAYMEKNDDIKCVIILGGDGTNRAAAKSLKDTPIITISTGTNNVYPTMLEGTVAGMAAAAVASGRFDDRKYVTKDKRIEIYKDGDLIDIALIDAVISKDVFIGSKAIWNMDTIEIITRNYVNMGVAVALPEGLLVPVVKYANVKGLKEISNEIKDLGERAKSYNLMPDELTGGTFTISNLGMYGIESFTPIINQPEVAILGVNAIHKESVVVNDELVLKPMMNLSLTADHRVVDGAVAAEFLAKLKEYIERPGLLLL